MRLAEYIEQIGVDTFAKKFKLSPYTALAYQKKERRPRPLVAQKIIRNSPVSWEGIYAPYPGES